MWDLRDVERTQHRSPPTTSPFFPVKISRKVPSVRVAATLLASALVLGACDAPSGVTDISGAEPRLAGAASSAPASFIVVFKDDVADPAELARSLAAANGFRPTFTYTAALKGFAAQLPEPAREALSRNPNVAYIEADGVAYANQLITRSTTLWGLDRIDTRPRTYDGSYTAQNTGAGVEVYIMDTGILYGHQEFGGRAAPFFDAFTDGRNGSDCDGHGTHVAGTVGGATVGVAPGVSLFSVRVLDCTGSGSRSGVIAGVDAVTARKNANKAIPMVGNMSLGGGLVSSLNTAVTNAVTAGVVMVVAAGNSNANACNYSPAATPSALTVGATENNDARASYSNFGSCVDLFAPGSGITSSWYTGNTVYASLSGTSMASPHVAGVAALYLSANPTATSSAANTAIVGTATTGVVTSAGTGSPNLLLYNQFVPPTPYTLTVTTPTNGTVTGTGINCGTDCTETILSGTSITLTATPAVGFRFTGWTGACTNVTGTCTVLMSDNRTVGANFAPLPTLHAGDLALTRTVAKNGSWSATLRLTAHGDAHAGIGGVAVSVRWRTNTGVVTTSSCTTSTQSSTLGTCSMTRNSLASSVASVTAEVTAMTRSGYGYDASKNHLANGSLVIGPLSINK